LTIAFSLPLCKIFSDIAYPATVDPATVDPNLVAITKLWQFFGDI